LPIECGHTSTTSRACYSFNCQGNNSEKLGGAMMCWPHLQVRYLSRGGTEGTIGTLRPGTPANRLEVKIRSRAYYHMLPCVQQHQTLSPYRGGLQCHHVSHGSRPHLPVEEGSGAAMCLEALDPTTMLRRALLPSHAQQLWISPPAEEGFGVAMCPAAPDPASPLRRASVPPHIQQLWTLPPH
jgi:hypothetical protein